VSEASRAHSVDEDLCGHPAELEKVHFLAVEFEDGGCGIGEADEGKIVVAPIRSKGWCAFGPNDDNLALSIDKVLIVLAQLRQMRSAKGSEEAAVENEEHVFAATQGGQAE